MKTNKLHKLGEAILGTIVDHQIGFSVMMFFDGKDEAGTLWFTLTIDHGERKPDLHAFNDLKSALKAYFREADAYVGALEALESIEVIATRSRAEDAPGGYMAGFSHFFVEEPFFASITSGNLTYGSDKAVVEISLRTKKDLDRIQTSSLVVAHKTWTRMVKDYIKMWKKKWEL